MNIEGDETTARAINGLTRTQKKFATSATQNRWFESLYEGYTSESNPKGFGRYINTDVAEGEPRILIIAYFLNGDALDKGTGILFEE